MKFSYTNFNCGELFKENSGDSLCHHVSRLPPQETQYASRSLANFGLIQGASFVRKSFIGIWPCPLVYILSMVAVILKWQLSSCYIDWMAAEFKIFTIGLFKKKFTYLCSKSLELLAASVCGIQSIVPFGLCAQPPKY